MKKACFLLLLLSRFIAVYSIDTHWDLVPMVIKMKLEITLYIIYAMGVMTLFGFLRIKVLPVMTDSDFVTIL